MPAPAAFAVCTEANKTNYYLLKELSMDGYTLESGQQKHFLQTSPSAARGPLPRAISEETSCY